MLQNSDAAAHGRRAQDTSVVILVGADSATIDRAVALGLNVFLIQTPAKYEATTRNVVGTLILDYSAATQDALVEYARAVAKNYRVLCAVSLTELGLMAAAWINQALGTPGVSPRAVELTRDKAQMRKAFEKIQPLAAAVVTSADAAAAFGQQHGWPIILKPLDGYGSRLVKRVDDVSGLSGMDWTAGDWLAEQYLAGRLISVEAFSFAGKHFMYGINEEFPVGKDGPPKCNPHVETAHQLPAELSAAEVAQINAFVPKVLDALLIDQGPSHTEVILTQSGPQLIECHTRPGGDFVPEMLQRCTGVDLLSLCIAWPAGLASAPTAPIEWSYGASMHFFTPAPGRVKHVSGVEACEDIPGVAAIKLFVKAGDTVQPLVSSIERVGYVMAVCRSSAEAVKKCVDVIQRVRLEIEEDAADAGG